ncbi:MAG: hypothetical protein Q8N53_17330 [Longimicrobiales bacterium]|nr:hypothetical protein [Longimicrobiales bacterium]
MDRHRERGAWVTSGALVTLALLACASPAGAQGTVRQARLQADLTGASGEAAVRVEYVLGGVAPGDSVPVSLLDFGPAIPFDFRVGEGAESLSLSRLRGAARGGHARVEGTSDGQGRLVVTYRVPLPADRSGVVVSHLPVLRADLPLEGSRPGLWAADVRVPAGWRVTEAFPTGLVPFGTSGEWVGELQVVPTVVTLRARPDGAWRPGLLLLLNLLAAGVVVFTCVAGWRHLTAKAA